MDEHPRSTRHEAVVPAAAAAPSAETRPVRWVLLAPPNAVTTFWWRALAVTLLVLTLVLQLDLLDVAGPRAAGTWTLLTIAAVMTAVGAAWLWVAAALPRPIDSEITRLAPTRPGRRERRRLAQALRGGQPLAPEDRPAAAAYTAIRHHDLHNPGPQLAVAGFAITVGTDTASGTSDWLLPALVGALSVAALATACHARAVVRAAARADVAPLVSQTPQELRDIGPTASR